MADRDATAERQRVRLAALTFAGLAAVTFVVVLALGAYLVAAGCAIVSVAAGMVALRLYGELHAEEIARAAQHRASSRIVAAEPPPAQYGPTS
jgi:hypothetical protein